MTDDSEVVRIEDSVGNVFEDLGLRDPDELLAKAELARRISQIIRGRRLTQTEAAEALGTTQPNVSNLVNGRLQGISFGRLLRHLNALGRDVEIVVKPCSRGRARVRVEGRA
jgi:predicted XRE-type DNA-binding protein